LLINIRLYFLRTFLFRCFPLIFRYRSLHTLPLKYVIPLFTRINIVAYRPVATRWLCKQRTLLRNSRNIHAYDNRTTGLCNRFLSNGSVNTIPRKWTRTQQ
jgi:hypothetical protein